MPGSAEIHQATAILSLPSANMEPQAGVGDGTPAPRKLRAASKRIITPTSNVATTITLLVTPGRM